MDNHFLKTNKKTDNFTFDQVSSSIYSVITTNKLYTLDEIKFLLNLQKLSITDKALINSITNLIEYGLVKEINGFRLHKFIREYK